MMKPYGLLGLGVVAGFIGGTVLMSLTGNGVVNAAGAANKAEIEAIVKDYIAANGNLLMESIQSAMNREQMAKVANIVTDANPSLGPKDAPVTVIEFSDYQCPFCDRVQGSVRDVRAKYGDKVRWVYKNLPLPFHPEGKPAAYAALAAHKQGKFWEYHDKLWANQANLGEKTYVAIATELKLDMAAFNKDRASDAIKQQVEQDMADAEAVGARGTPHFVINGEAISGAQPAEAFAEVIDAKLAK